MTLRPAFLALCLLMLSAVPPARAADEDAALATASALVEGAHGALTDPGLDGAARDARLRAAVEAAFAFDIWEKFLLGERAGDMSQAERAAFRDRLPGFLAHLYRTQFGRGLEAKPVIRDTRPARSDILVRAAIPRSTGDPLPVDWRVRDFGERGHLVIDVMVGGVSFLVLKREEFGEILSRDGVAGLLAYMEANSL